MNTMESALRKAGFSTALIHEGHVYLSVEITYPRPKSYRAPVLSSGDGVFVSLHFHNDEDELSDVLSQHLATAERLLSGSGLVYRQGYAWPGDMNFYYDFKVPCGGDVGAVRDRLQERVARLLRGSELAAGRAYILEPHDADPGRTPVELFEGR